MFRFVLLGIVWVSLSSLSWGAETASSQHMSLSDVLQQVLKQHTSLKISALQEQSLALDAAAAREKMDLRASLNGQLSDETSPTTNPFAPSGTNIASLRANLSQPLENGATLTLSSSYTRSKTIYPSSVPLAFQATINPTYQHQIDLIYRYPLLKGHDNTAYHAQLQQIDDQKQVAHWQYQIQQEQLAAQAAQLYFQLAANEVAVQLSQDAVQRARRLLAYQKKQEHLGLIEQADRLQTRALLATRQMELVNAQNTLRSSQTALNRLMQRSYKQPIHTRWQNTPSRTPPSMSELLQQAQQHRPIFKQLKAQKAAAQAALQKAQAEDQAQLDIIGQIGTRALSGSATAALGQGFSLKDRYIGIGFEWSDSLTHHDIKPAIQKAELDLTRIQLQRQQALEDIMSTCSEARIQFDNARRTQQAIRQRIQMERKKFNAEMKRYRQGRSNTATIIQYEGALRTIELQQALQDIQLHWATFRLQLAAGTWKAQF